MGDASLPAQHLPSQHPVPESSPSSPQCPRLGGTCQARGVLRACGTMPGTWREQLRPCSHASEPWREGGSSWVAMEERKQLREKPFQAGRNQWGTRAGAAGLPAAGGGGEHLCTVWRWRGRICLSIDGAGGRKPPPLSIPMDAELPGSPPPAPLLPLLHSTSWAVLSSHLWVAQGPTCPLGAMLPAAPGPGPAFPAACAGLCCSVQITP